jgi:lipopolysaccharide biosynthesis glycosyltransferase
VNIVFCADHRVLPGLHVAAYSLLAKVSPEMPCTRFHLFSDELAAADVELLRRTLSRLIKPFALELHRADATAFAGLPSLNGSRATYYRLFAAKVMDVDRFLYVDADTLCDVELTELESMDLGDLPAAWVPSNWAMARISLISMLVSSWSTCPNGAASVLPNERWNTSGADVRIFATSQP